MTKAGCADPPDSMNMGSLIEQLNEPALRSARMHADADDMEYEEEDLLFGSEPPVRADISLTNLSVPCAAC